MTIFDVRIPELNLQVVATDGQNIEPVTVDEFRIGVAETYDVIITPKSDQAYTLFAQSIDRTGFAVGRITPNLHWLPDIPEMAHAPILTHRDMGMTHHAGMQHGDMTHKGMRHGDMKHGDMKHESMKHESMKQGNMQHEAMKQGNMRRYLWSMDGIKFADADPIQLKYGERLRIVLVNDSMMTHPIHLHGLWSELETGDPKNIPRKHTILVQPGSTISYLVTADALGRWAYHCHLLYHMPGMMREVRVS